MTVAADLRRLGDGLDPMVAKALGKSALAVKRTMLDGLGKYRQLSGVGRRGAKLGVRYDYVKGARGQAVKIRAVGPWQFVEFDRAGGYQIPRARKRARKKAPILHFGSGDDFATGPIRGGRASGRHIWKRHEAAALEQVGDVFVAALGDVMRRAG